MGWLGLDWLELNWLGLGWLVLGWLRLAQFGSGRLIYTEYTTELYLLYIRYILYIAGLGWLANSGRDGSVLTGSGWAVSGWAGSCWADSVCFSRVNPSWIELARVGLGWLEFAWAASGRLWLVRVGMGCLWLARFVSGAGSTSSLSIPNFPLPFLEVVQNSLQRGDGRNLHARAQPPSVPKTLSVHCTRLRTMATKLLCAASHSVFGGCASELTLPHL